MKENNIDNISLSYFGLRRRTKFTKGWDISKYFPTENVFVDSGCATINGKENDYSEYELRAIAEHYYSWVYDNIGAIEYFTEFDAQQLGDSFLKEQRNSIPDAYRDKFVPIWQPNSGTSGLDNLSQQFRRIGILQTSIGNRDLVPHLNKLASKGFLLHGLSMSKPDIMQAVSWQSTSSTSWVSPMQYGDTIIWSHNQLKRYPKSMKIQARKKERQTFISAGFDLEKIEKDDSRELLRVSLWSWSKLVESINGKRRGVTAPMNFDDDGFSENYDDEVGGVVERPAKRLPTPKQRDPSQKQIIPLIGFEPNVVKIHNQDGSEEEVNRPLINVRSESLRICDSCFLAPKCPMFEENSTCAYDIPIQVRTREQVQSLMDSLVEMQAQRVLFMKMVEDSEGGLADPVLSGEMDRLGKLIEKKHNMEQEGFSLTVTAKQQGQMDMMNRLFGGLSNQSFTALEAPVEVQDAISSLGIQDAMVEDF